MRYGGTDEHLAGQMGRTDLRVLVLVMGSGSQQLLARRTHR